jgi:glycosyltransferase involved in cell wall biosynthesis
MPDQQPEISVIMPVYNGEPYVGAAIDSIIQQTYRAFSIVILESCSTDGTVSTIDSYRDRYPDAPISVLRAASLLGIEDNWKRILDLDLSEYMTILGQDDLLYPDFLGEIADLIRVSPEASLYHTHFDFIDSGGNVVRPSRAEPYRETGDEWLRSLHLGRRDSRATGFVMRSADYKRIGGFPGFPSLMYADDATWYQLAANSYKVCSPRCLFAFRVHEQSASHLVNVHRLYEASKRYLDFLAGSDYGRSSANMALARRYVEQTFNGQYHRILVGLIASSDPGQFRDYVEIKNRLLAEAAKDRLFHVYDIPSGFYEAVARLPYPLRALPLGIILGVRRIRRYLRERDVRPASTRA